MGHSQETILPSVDELNVFEHGRFVLSNVAAKRAKQIKDGAPPLVDIPSIHPLSLALGEIATYKLKSVLKSEEEEDKKNILDESVTDTSQLGFLLPSLDDLDIHHNLLPEEDVDVKQEVHEMSLDELLLDEDPLIEQDQITPDESDELDSISLNELENQENLEDFDENKDLE